MADSDFLLPDNYMPDPTMGNMAWGLQSANAAEGNPLASAQPATAGYRETLAKKMFNPIQNMQNSWSSLKSDWKDPKTNFFEKSVNVMGDINNLRHPLAASQQGKSRIPQLDPSHYGDPGDDGLVPINGDGFKHIDNSIVNNNPIADNSSQIRPAIAAPIQEPPNAPPQKSGDALKVASAVKSFAL
jgi:hypothetical protein